MAKILLIDEDVALLASLGNCLEEAGFAVIKTSEPDHGELLLDEEQPDIVVMEVHLRNDRGWALLEQLAERLPVIVLSMHGREEDVVRGLSLGALDYIAKPYRSEELIARVRLRLGQYKPVAREFGKSTATSTNRLAPTRPAAPIQHDESVFMSEAEELALLRIRSSEDLGPSREPLPPQGIDSTISMGQQFNLERQRRRLTLVQAESELKVPMSYLQAIEDDKFTLLPRGPIATQMLRQYADYLNLDTASIVAEFQRLHYAEPVEPHPSLGGPRLRRTLPGWMAPLLAVALALVISIGGIYYFDRDGVTDAVSNLRSLVLPQGSEAAPAPNLAPTLVPTLAPTVAPTTAPTAAPSPTPGNSGTPEPTAASTPR